MSVQKFLLNLGAVLAALSLVYTAMQIVKTDFILSEFIAAPFLFYALGTMFFVQKFEELEKELSQKEIALCSKTKNEKATINDITTENDKLKNEIQSLQSQIESLKEERDEAEIKYKAAYKVGLEHYQDLQDLKKQNHRRKF